MDLTQLFSMRSEFFIWASFFSFFLFFNFLYLNMWESVFIFGNGKSIESKEIFNSHLFNTVQWAYL